MKIRERIENNLTIFFLATLMTGFLAGIGAYDAILNIAHLKVIPEGKYEQSEAKTVLPVVTTPPVDPKTIYEDKQSDVNIHDIKFVELTASCSRNPPKVNDRIFVDFTIQNVADMPISILGTYVTAYDPSGEEKSFAYANKNKIIKPQEIIKTSGSLIVDVPGIWEVGPHYQLRKEWKGQQYPGHWKRFQILVAQ